MHSWRVLILPMIDEDLLYRQYRFDEPWNGPNNSKLAAKMPRVYRCPSDRPGSVFTSYVAVAGPGTMWDGVNTAKLGDIQDGPAQTIAVVEIANSGICWMEPRDLDMLRMTYYGPARGSLVGVREITNRRLSSSPLWPTATCSIARSFYLHWAEY